MTQTSPGPVPPVVVRLWAAARAAAGQAEVTVTVDGPVSVAWLRDEVVRRHGAQLDRVLQVCSVLVGDRPLGTADPNAVTVEPGGTVEFLPPFAGG